MKRFFILAISLIYIASGCSRIQVEVADEKSKIYIAANTIQSADTKSPYLATAPSSSAPLTALILASTTNGSFPNNGTDGTNADGTIEKHVVAEFQNSAQQLINGIYYNQNHRDKEAYFAGLFPETGWSFSDDNKAATREFDGKTDIMFAPTTIGKYGNDPRPALEFQHLLTYLKIEIGVESESARDAWGKITSMKINSRNSLNLNLIDESVSFSPGEPLDFDFFDPADDTPFVSAEKSYTLNTTLDKDAAYIICSPVVATLHDQYDVTKWTTEYTIVLSTEHRTDIILDIDLKTSNDTYFTGSTAGRLFTIGLNFKMGNNIAVSTSITDWETGGIGTGDIEL